MIAIASTIVYPEIHPLDLDWRCCPVGTRLDKTATVTFWRGGEAARPGDFTLAAEPGEISPGLAA
jgi:hypothetical protein